MTQRIYVAQLNQRITIPGAIEVHPLSSNATWCELSPFYLGPCKTPDGVVFENMENLWQFSKAYDTTFARHLHKIRGGYNVTPEFFKWREAGSMRSDAVRYPMGKGAKPAFSYWKTPKRPAMHLDYITARKLIYAPVYAKLAAKTDAYAKLKRFYKKGKVLILRDFDAHHQVLFADDWIKYLNDPARKMGHAYVLAMMLEYGEKFYKQLTI